ncbi:helix-turn-helix domain-containing protein, partial [Enterococcus faecalis]
MERAFKGIWIPKNVWLDKELSWTEKFLIVEIDSLDNDDGCFASNEYFSNFFGLSKDRVSKLISGLKEKGYIDVSYQYKPGTKSIERRVVKITEGYRRKQLEGIGENNYRGIGENAKDNNTLINNTKNNTKNIYSVEQSSSMSELFEKVWKTYPKKTNKKKAKEQF